MLMSEAEVLENSVCKLDAEEMRYNYFKQFELLIIVSKALRFKLIENTKHIRW